MFHVASLPLKKPSSPCITHQQQHLLKSRPPPPRSGAAAIRTYVSGAPRGPAAQPLKVWPFIFIALAGTASYILMVKARANDPTTSKKNPRGPSITPQ